MSAFTSKAEQKDFSEQRDELREIFRADMSGWQRVSVIVDWLADLTMTPLGRLVISIVALSLAWFLI